MASRYERQRRLFPKRARRAQRAARREVRPVRRAAQKDIDRIERQGQRAAQGTRQAASRAAGYYTQAAQNIGGGVANAGLVRKQLGQMAEQTGQFGQGLATIAQRASKQDVRAIRQDMPKARPLAAEALATAVQEHRSVTAERQAARQAERQEAIRGRRQDAFGAASSLLNKYVVQDDGTMDPTAIPQDAQQWAGFRDVLQQSNPGMSPQLIERAIAQLRARLATQSSLPANVAGPQIREARPDVQRDLRRSYTQYFLGR